MRPSSVLVIYSALVTSCGGDAAAPPAPSGPSTFHLATKNLSDTIDARLPSAIQLTAADGQGRPLSSAVVTLRVIPDRVYIEPGVLLGTTRDTVLTLSTPSTGVLGVDATLGIHPGAYLVVVSVAGIARQDTVAFNVLPGAPVSMRLTAHDTLVTVGVPYRPGFAVSDRRGNARADVPTLTSSSDACHLLNEAVAADRVTRCVITAQLGTAVDSVSLVALPSGRATAVVSALGGRWVATMNLDGSSVKLIRAIKGTTFDAVHPSLGPSGIIAAMEVGADNKGHVMIIESNGDGHFVPVDLPVGAEPNWPIISRDGQWLYFSACVPQNFEPCRVWRSRLDGSQASPLTTALQVTGQRSNWPDVSSDGNTLIYSGDGERVHVLELPTGRDVELGFFSQVIGIDPTGTRFVSTRYTGTILDALVVSNLDGTNARNIAPGNGFYGTAQFLPGGEWIYSEQMIQDSPNTAHSGSRVLVNVNTGQMIVFSYKLPISEMYVVR